MEKEKGFEIPSCTDEMKRVIKNIREDIEKDFQTNSNSWLLCFVDYVEVLDNYLMLARDKKELEEDEFNILNNQIENLKVKVWDLRKYYSEGKSQPSDEIKEELITLFDIFK